MGDFFKALLDPDMAFLRYALFLGLIGSVPLGAVGTFVVARRISYLAAAIAHSVLGGIGGALYCREALGWGWVHGISRPRNFQVHATLALYVLLISGYPSVNGA